MTLGLDYRFAQEVNMTRHNIIDQVRDDRVVLYASRINIDAIAYTGGDELRDWMEERFNNSDFAVRGRNSEMDDVRDLCMWFPATWLGPVELDHIEMIRDRHIAYEKRKNEWREKQGGNGK